MKKQIMHFIFHTGSFFLLYLQNSLFEVHMYKRYGVNSRIIYTSYNTNDELQSTDDLFIEDAKYFCHGLIHTWKWKEDGGEGLRGAA